MDERGESRYETGMKWPYILLALAAGIVVPLQAGINVRLRTALGDASMAALVSFFVGTLGLAGWCLARGWPWAAGAVSRGPWWMWTGGFLGAFFVTATILAAAKLGAASMLAWVMASQLIAGLLLDQYGVTGFAVRDISWPRMAGVALLIVGAVLIEKY